MQNIGDRLAEARKRLGIALREASEATKIRTDYLQSMETGSFDFSLPEIYKVGFLKIYARYLKLDADKLASDYLAQFGGKAAGDRENLGRIDAPGGMAPAHGAAGRDAPADYVAARAQNQAGLWRLGGFLAIAFVVLMAIVFGVQHLFNSAASSDISKGAVTPATGNNTVTPPPVTPPPAATIPAIPPGPAIQQVTFAASGDIASLEVRQASDLRLLQPIGPLKKGKTLTVSSRGPIKFSVSEAKYLTIQINGGPVNSIGDGNGKIFNGPLKDISWPP